MNTIDKAVNISDTGLNEKKAASASNVEASKDHVNRVLKESDREVSESVKNTEMNKNPEEEKKSELEDVEELNFQQRAHELREYALQF